MMSLARLAAFPCAVFLFAVHVSGTSPRAGRCAEAVRRAQRELAIAGRTLVRQKQLHAQGEPQRDVDEARRDYAAKARELARLEACVGP